MDSIYRISNPAAWPSDYVDRILPSDAREGLRLLPDECVGCAITSPPYWDVKDYDHPQQIGQSGYDDYLTMLTEVWKETQRVLIPNGKLAIVTPIMPITKSRMNEQHTRHLKNISADIEHRILSETSMLHYSLFVWQKQTTVKMFGSYPYPPNIYEDNTIEFINVFVKPGLPIPAPKEAKEESKISQEEWRNLTMQVWPIYPADVKRSGGHPAPFPVVLPQRLIMMYTFAAATDAGFEGDIVLDMFNGTGATCVAARALGRHYIGIDLNVDYCQIAEDRIKSANFGDPVSPHAIILETVRVKSPRPSDQSKLFPEGSTG